jgi:hypothetical protein
MKNHPCLSRPESCPALFSRQNQFYQVSRNFLLLLFLSLTYCLHAQSYFPAGDFEHVQTRKGTEYGSRQINCRPERIALLPAEAAEASGMILLNGKLWIISDSGNPPELLALDTTSGEIIRRIRISNAVNTDWESLAQDDSFVYVGDFGNNYGNRTDLHILKIRKQDLLQPDIASVSAGYIRFHFADQELGQPQLNSGNFDCEALICDGGKLHLFTKEWSDKHTRHYVLPSDTGNYTAVFKEEFPCKGLITDASLNENGALMLLGYRRTFGFWYSCFAWYFEPGLSGSIPGIPVRIKLGNAFRLGQTEGLVLSGYSQGWIVSEEINVAFVHRKARLLRFDTSIPN